MRVFDVDAEPQLLENPSLGFDHLIFERQVGRVQNHG